VSIWGLTGMGSHGYPSHCSVVQLISLRGSTSCTNTHNFEQLRAFHQNKRYRTTNMDLSMSPFPGRGRGNQSYHGSSHHSSRGGSQHQSHHESFTRAPPRQSQHGQSSRSTPQHWMSPGNGNSITINPRLPSSLRSRDVPFTAYNPYRSATYFPETDTHYITNKVGGPHEIRASIPGNERWVQPAGRHWLFQESALRELRETGRLHWRERDQRGYRWEEGDWTGEARPNFDLERQKWDHSTMRGGAQGDRGARANNKGDLEQRRL